MKDTATVGDPNPDQLIMNGHSATADTFRVYFIEFYVYLLQMCFFHSGYLYGRVIRFDFIFHIYLHLNGEG